MIEDNRKSFLELKIIWKDDDMFELKVTASNIEFRGTTELYDQPESLAKFASALIGFPKDSETLFYEKGEKDSCAYFSMKYYIIRWSGYLEVEICLESNVSDEYRQEEKSKVKLEIIVESNAIDNFQRELLHLAKNKEGSAILYGNDNRLDN